MSISRFFKENAYILHNNRLYKDVCDLLTQKPAAKPAHVKVFLRSTG